MESINKILQERGDNYGDFITQAYLSQQLKALVVKGENWGDMRPFQAEAMSMIIHKIARIINGDPDYVDSWRDVEGYAKLVADILESHKTDPN